MSAGQTGLVSTGSGTTPTLFGENDDVIAIADPVTRAAFRNASLEKKMINLHDPIADDPEYHICRMFLQFEQHGAIISYEAYILEDLGFLKSEPYYWSEIKDPIKIFKMTFKAKKSSLKFRRDWAKKYLPKYDLKSDEIPDLFDLAALDDNQWD